MTIALQCAMCANLWGVGKCEAYPDGIPAEIMTGEHDHTEPYPGDNGIRFEPREPDAEP